MRNFLILMVYLSIGFSSELIAQDSNPDSLFSLGQDFYSQAKYEEAAGFFDNAASAYLHYSDSLKWMDSKIREGDALKNAGQLKRGLELLLAINKRVPKNATVTLKASLHDSFGKIYRELEQYEKSIQHYLNGIELSNTSGDSVLIATLNNNISYPYLYSGNYQDAFGYQNKAKEIYEAVGDDYRLSFVLNGIFLTLLELGLHQQAEPYIRQSLAIRKELGNPNLLDVAYHNLAWNFEQQGKRDSSVIYYQKSLELSRQLGNPFDITQTLNNIGSLYERSGDYENALAYYNEALQANYQTERPISTANNLVRMARVAIQNDDLDNAGTFYNEALDWLNQTAAPRPLANLYLDIAKLNMLKEHYKDAEHYLAEAEAISKNHNFNNLQIRSHSLRGEQYKAEEKWVESLGAYRRAYALSARETVTSKIAPAMNLAKAYNQIQSDSAFILANEAFKLIDSVRTNVAGLAFRSGFFSQHAGFYNEVASWHITQKNNPEKAFDLVEAAKARVLMDELAEARERAYESLDETTLIKKRQKAKQIDRLYNQINSAESVAEINALRNELKDLEFEYQTFLNQIQVSEPLLKEFKYPEPVTLEQAQRMLDPETAIIEFAVTEQKLIQLFIDQDNIEGKVIEEKNAPFTEQIRLFRDAITTKESVDDIKILGAELYENLVPELDSDGRSNISNLLIIPGGALTFLPFEALSKNNRFLIQDYNIKYLPSASIYPLINNPHRTTDFELLALAGSGFESSEGAGSLSSSQASFASLPSTLLEVDSIAVNFTNYKVLKNEDVTEASLKSHDLSRFRFIHFATHAEVNESTPSQSGLLLSKKTDVESLFGEDGYLNSREISGLRLNADLVTLSACNTGMGKIVTGEGLLGLQRSFLSAGASSVMVSLWSVFDRSTSVFMSHFYKRMLVHEETDYGLWAQTLNWFGMYEHPLFDYKSKSLRDAKLSMIEHPYYNHPIYWAPFILIGK